MADADDVAGDELVRGLPEMAPVHDRRVRRAHVGDPVVAKVGEDLRVAARDVRIVDANVRVLGAADDAFLFEAMLCARAVHEPRDGAVAGDVHDELRARVAAARLCRLRHIRAEPLARLRLAIHPVLLGIGTPIVDHHLDDEELVRFGERRAVVRDEAGERGDAGHDVPNRRRRAAEIAAVRERARFFARLFGADEQHAARGLENRQRVAIGDLGGEIGIDRRAFAPRRYVEDARRELVCAGALHAQLRDDDAPTAVDHVGQRNDDARLREPRLFFADEAHQFDARAHRRDHELDLRRDDVALRAERSRERTRACRRIGHVFVAVADRWSTSSE